MAKFLVAGVTQIETIVKAEKIPIEYSPLTFRQDSIFTSVGGDAYNESLALIALGNSVKFLSMVGKEQELGIFNPHDSDIMLPTKNIMKVLDATPTAVIFFDKERHQQKFEDIKNLHEAVYDMNAAEPLLQKADMVVLANANFCRPICYRARQLGKKIAVNIRSFSREKMVYNEDFYSAADIIYLSDDNLDEDPFDFVREISDTYGTSVVILGRGAEGAILYDRDRNENLHFNAVKTKEIVNTAGAGNALFACFLHTYLETGDSVTAIKNALLFASYKIGFMGTSNGFMTPSMMEEWREKIWFNPDPFGALMKRSMA